MPLLFVLRVPGSSVSFARRNPWKVTWTPGPTLAPRRCGLPRRKPPGTRRRGTFPRHAGWRVQFCLLWEGETQRPVMLPSAPRRPPVARRAPGFDEHCRDPVDDPASRSAHTGWLQKARTPKPQRDPPGSDKPSSAEGGKTALLGRALRPSTCPLTGSTTTNSREMFRELRKDAYAPNFGLRQDKNFRNFIYFTHKLPHRFSTGLWAACPRILVAKLWESAPELHVCMVQLLWCARDSSPPCGSLPIEARRAATLCPSRRTHLRGFVLRRAQAALRGCGPST